MRDGPGRQGSLDHPVLANASEGVNGEGSTFRSRPESIGWDRQDVYTRAFKVGMATTVLVGVDVTMGEK